MHSRNYIYIKPKNQKKIKQCRLLIGGCGLGSVISECAIRLGFENICIINGDKVELSNLNRQNYTYQDIGRYKVDALYDRLILINPNASIQVIPEFLTEKNISKYLLPVFDIAINTIDFCSNMPFIFDDICCVQEIPILHPLNLGWGAAVFLITQNSKKISCFSTKRGNVEIQIVKHILEMLEKDDIIPEYLTKALSEYDLVKDKVTAPPQLSVGSWIAASMCTSLMHKLCLNHELLTFPEVYFKAI